MAKIVYRKVPAPRSYPNKSPRAKASVQKPQGGGIFFMQIPGGAGGWLWQKLTAALPGHIWEV